ncbi:MAG: hypothetical protein KAJ19_22785 [Gammaproteobacteria bacterium]|nr:hypothetical protein [Gammaproteobacteria bacterium]
MKLGKKDQEAKKPVKFEVLMLFTLDGTFQGSTDIELTTGSLNAELMRQTVEKGVIIPMAGLIEHLEDHPQRGLTISRKDTTGRKVQK